MSAGGRARVEREVYLGLRTTYQTATSVEAHWQIQALSRLSGVQCGSPHSLHTSHFK
jgi:hypothetical protein